MRRNRDYKYWRRDIDSATSVLHHATETLKELSFIIGKSASSFYQAGINASELYRCQRTIINACNSLDHFRVFNVWEVVDEARTKREIRKKEIS